MPKDVPVRRSNYFDFLSNLGYDDNMISRLNWRHAHIVLPLLDDIKGARILDLGSHDGRWPSAYADAGAREVIGIEGRDTLVAKFDQFPGENKDRVKLRVGDFVEEMDRMIAAGETFDVVSCLGVYYHTMHHYRIMCQMATFKPKLIIVDSEFSRSKAPVITISKEKPTSDLNTIEQFKGQTVTAIGLASRRAVRLMASSVGYGLQVLDWNVPAEEREPVKDYYDRWPNRVRETVLLRPLSGGAEDENE